MKTKFIALFIGITALLSGCAQKKMSAFETLSAMNSYTAKAEVTYISNKGENVYQTMQYAKKDGRYRIDNLASDGGTDTSIIYDGKLVWQTRPGNDNKIKVTSNTPERSLLLLYSFMENHAHSGESAAFSSSASPAHNLTVLEAVIPGGSKFFAEEKLWFDETKNVPVKLVVYNDEGKEKIVVNFSDFLYNEEIEDTAFSPTAQ